MYVNMTYTAFMDKVSFIKVRKIPGYHDELLKGKRKGQRSIRLSKAYRAFYTEYKYEGINTISIEEINKHEY